MKIARIIKSLLCVYTAVLVGATVLAGLSNTIERTTFVAYGGEADSYSATGTPTFSSTQIVGD